MLILKRCFAVLYVCAFAFSVQSGYAQKSSAFGKMPPTVVSTVPAQKRTFQDSLQATGTLAATDGVAISPEISGRITKIDFQSGQWVKAGDLLIELNSDVLKAQLNKAESQLALKRLNYDRLFKLYRKSFYGKADLDQAKVDCDGAQADVDNLKAQLEYTRIKAPFDGRLGLNKVSVGQYVSPGSALVNIQAIDPLYVEFNVPESYLAQMQVGNKVTVRSESFPNDVYGGKVYALDSMVDPATRMLMVRATIPNPKRDLMPGMFVDVKLSLGKGESILAIPQIAVVYDMAGNYVYRMVDHKAAKTLVTLGNQFSDGGLVVIKGLQDGDQVILGGGVNLADGAAVMTEQEAKVMTEAMSKALSKK